MPSTKQFFDVIDHFSSFTCYRSCLLNKSRKRRSLCSNLGGIDPLDPGHLNFRQVCCLTFGMRNQTSEFSNGSPETVLIFFYDFPCGVVNLHVPVNLSQKVIQYKFDHRTDVILRVRIVNISEYSTSLVDEIKAYTRSLHCKSLRERM